MKDTLFIFEDMVFEGMYEKKRQAIIREKVRKEVLNPNNDYSYNQILENAGTLFNYESLLNIAWGHAETFEFNDECIYYIAVWIYDNFKHLSCIQCSTVNTLASEIGDCIESYILNK